MKNEKAVIYGAILSLFLIIIFGWLQASDSKLLKLPFQWLAVAILPIIVGLFVGGFITRFKGFGVELETTLKAPVASLSLTASDAVADIPGDDKKSIMYLDELSIEKKQSIRWLLFRYGKENYYSLHGIERYLIELPNLEYFEIRSKTGNIICFIPISTFKSSVGNHDNIYNQLQKLIDAVENENVPEIFSDSVITLKVSSDQGLVDVLRAIRTEKTEFASVVSPSGKYLGVIFANEVEKKIADSVLAVS